MFRGGLGLIGLLLGKLNHVVIVRKPTSAIPAYSGRLT